jgi:hypothetical protein
MEKYYETICDTFNYYKNMKNGEIEFRFGKINRSSFDTNVGSDVFARVLRRLKKYNEWEKIETTEAEVFYYDNNIRYSLIGETGTTIQKTKVKKTDYSFDNGYPFDIRFCASTEKPAEYPNEESSRMVNKYRESFIRKNLSIDMTIISGDPMDPDTEEEQIYQIELEIIDPTKVQTENELFAHIYKIQCIFDLI